jgi:hypothetical protein
MKNIYLLIFIGTTIFLGSCDIKKSNVSPDATFVKVYESQNIDEEYYPLSIVENGNSGYLILSAIIDSSAQIALFPRVHILAINSEGDVISTLTLPIENINPVPGWLHINNKNYIVCMDQANSNTKISEIVLNGEMISINPIITLESQNPLYAWEDDENVLILSYSFLSRNSKVECFDQNLNPVWESSFSAKQDFETVVTQHLQKRGDELPFFAGDFINSYGSKDYFVNCLENQTIALLFINGNSGSVTGRVYGQGVVGAISSTMQLNDTSMALSRFDKGENYILPSVNIDRNTLNNTNDFIGKDIHLSQLIPNAKVDVLKYTLSTKEYLLYATTTNNNQIMLLFFDTQTGKQVYTHYLGYGNPVEVKQVIQTSDSGLAILGKTRINERYRRIILYKVSSDQLDLD